MASYATLTIDLRDILGVDFDHSRASALIEFGGDDGVLDVIVVDGTVVRAGSRREYPAADGTITFPGLVTTNSADNPASFGYRVKVIYTPKGSRKQGHDSWVSGWFPLTASANIASIDEAWDNLTLPVSWRSVFRGEMEAIRDDVIDISNISTSDAVVAALLNTVAGPLTQAAFADTFGDEVGTAGSPVRLAADAVYGPRLAALPKAGSRLAAKLDMGIGDIRIHTASDSTGNDAFEWPRLAAGDFVTRTPDLGVLYRLWDDTTKTYPSTTTLQAPTAPSVTAGWATMFRDTFSVGSGEVVGRTPDVAGPIWQAMASNAAGDWSVSGGAAVRTSDATTSPIGVTLERGDVVVTLTGINLSTVGDTVARTFNVQVKHIDVNNYLWLRISITATTGVVTWNLFKTVAGTSTSLATGSATPLVTNTGSVSFNLVVSVIGTAFTAVISPTSPSSSDKTVTATLTSPEQTFFADGANVAISASAGTLAGMIVSDVKVDVNRAGDPGYSLTVINGAMPGATLAYHTTNMAAMYPQSADLLMISMGHNYDIDTGSAYLTAMGNFITAYRAIYPGTPVLVMSQNPQFEAGTALRTRAQVRGHARRFIALREWAADNGYDYLPIFETFAALPSGGRAWCHADGIHLNYDPSRDSPLDGSRVWANVVQAYFDALLYRADL